MTLKQAMEVWRVASEQGPTLRGCSCDICRIENQAAAAVIQTACDAETLALREALALWIAYDEGDTGAVEFMLAYDRAITATRALLADQAGEGK